MWEAVGFSPSQLFLGLPSGYSLDCSVKTTRVASKFFGFLASMILWEVYKNRRLCLFSVSRELFEVPSMLIA